MEDCVPHGAGALCVPEPLGTSPRADIAWRDAFGESHTNGVTGATDTSGVGMPKLGSGCTRGIGGRLTGNSLTKPALVA